MQRLIAKRRVESFHPDNTRVIARPFLPGNPVRLARISERILALSDPETNRNLDQVMTNFQGRHRNIKDIFLRHFELLLENLPEKNSLLGKAQKLTTKKKLLLGAYFSCEYSIEAAALFNPSMVPHPDQEGLDEGSTRFVISFRATGEGHVSSIVFRTGIIDAQHELAFEPANAYAETPKVVENPSYDKHCFALKLEELGLLNFVSKTILARLAENFTFKQLEDQVWYFGEKHPTLHCAETVDTIKWLAHSNYQLCFRADGDLSECVIFPVSENESKGLEDARFVRFVAEDGAVTYYATYTAYNGFTILPQILLTKDFISFDITTLNGTAIQNKGMALFPRKVGGKFTMLSRQDGENMYLMTSDNLHFWNEVTPLQQPKESWEIVQLGNCGSPIETTAGWLVLTHGVGPMRQYCIGAILLDIDKPTRVIGRLTEPVLIPNEREREGYVPNVVYSCGAMVHAGELIIPYAMSDSVSGIATLSLSELLERLT